ncbi:MAG: hypothetical protein EWV55_01725, partial [Microcystis viridis Mv_BB_P_19951000_S69]
FFGKIGCNGRLFVFLDKNNYFFKKTLFYFFVGYFILWKSLSALQGQHGGNHRGFAPTGTFKSRITKILGLNNDES